MLVCVFSAICFLHWYHIRLFNNNNIKCMTETTFIIQKIDQKNRTCLNICLSEQFSLKFKHWKIQHMNDIWLKCDMFRDIVFQM